jgi:ATP-binding cassette subfamily F protein uup
MRGDRIGLIGPNGSGKTTLLRLLVGEMEPDAGTIRRGTRLRIAYYDQQREQLDPDATVADSVNDGNTTVMVNGQPKHIIGYLGDFLFPRERALSLVKSLSGGERNRLLLARLFAKPANVLVLDEPTNDLDIETLELLGDLIGDFAGTVLLVSHDRVFLDRIVTSTLAFEGEGRVTEYVGGWQDYLRQSVSTRSVQAHPPRTNEPPASTPQPLPAHKRRLSFKEQRELAGLPSRIESLEVELASLRAEMESANFYKAGGDHIRQVLTRIEDVQRELDSAIARWMELEERERR